MKKKVFSLMMTLLLAFMGVAKADVVAIGDGTSTTSRVPYNSLWGYSFVEQIYTADEIGTAGTINAISFNMSSTDTQTNTYQVFMKNVSRSTFSATSDYEVVTAADMVFSGTWTVSAGWNTLTLDTPFAYDGTSNLLIAFHEYTSGYSTRYFYYTSASDKVLSFHSDSYDPNPYDLGSYSGSSYTGYERANIQIDITPGGGGGETVEVTIGDPTSTTTNSYLPTYSLYEYSFTQQIYTADEIGVGGTINSFTMWLKNSSSYARNLNIYMKEVSESTFASGSSWVSMASSDMVATFTLANGIASPVETTISLSTPFEYSGNGNLVICVQDVTGSWSSGAAGVQMTTDVYQALYAYRDGTVYDPANPGSGTLHSYKNVLKLNITTAGGGSGTAGEQIFAVQDGNTVDTVYVGARPNGCWMEPFKFQIRNTGANTTINHLDWTPNTYFELVEPELPVNIARDEDIDVLLNTGESTNTEWQMVALYGTGRTAAIWTMVVEPYDPAIPDVVEMAYDLGTVGNGFSYQGVPSQITPTVLHNDYTLPFPEIEEGEDAVYKFTVAQDMIISAHVDTAAENGKVALYTEDFYGEGGPMAGNYYQGLDLNGSGGGAGGPFEVQIGTGTSTTGYLPMYYLYNYSLSTQLYLGTELAEAGVTTAPMNSIAWYSESTYGYNIQNISIWMANVSDTQAPTTSPLGSGMSLVYQGNFQEVVGWNEFVFNAGSFAWDGTSNVLVMVQMNNGNWNSSISWQCGNVGFTAGSYVYQDNTPYNAGTTTYSGLSTTTNRANTKFKGGNREGNREVLTQDFESGLGDWTMNNCHSSTGVSTSYTAHGGSGVFRFYYTTAVPQYLISPMLADNNGGSMSFFYARYSTSYPETFQVGHSTTTNDPSAFTWGSEVTSINTYNTDGYLEYSYDFPAGTKYVSIRCTSNDQFYLFIDDITITTAGGGQGGGSTALNVSAGPVIENLGLTPGTYYLVASATEADYDVFINVDNMPCPAINAEGFAFNPQPADNEDEVEPASVTLRWMNPQYATAWRIIFGSTYHPEAGHPQTIITDWSEDMATSYTVRNLWNNTNYFWRVEFKNDACPDGVSSPIWGFTTHLNIPQNLTAVDETVFDDETIVLNWNAVVDRTYRQYNVYRDGQLIGHTQVNNIGNTTYTDGPLAYNMGGYVYYVTAVYDEGESAPSNTVTVKVSGYGDVNGHVYEQDGTTGIANATVHMVGQDEFGVNHTYNFTTNNQGYYTGHIYAGEYNGSASCDGYQTINEPVQGNPIDITYNQTTTPIDYILDENFDPVCAVIAEYYPDSLDPESPYVKVYWGCGLPGSEIIEDFETGDFSMFDWQVDSNYPWSITTNNPYEGTYCMKSGGAGVASVTSNMTVTVEIPADGLMSFFGKISSESNYDYGHFYIDGVEKGNWSGAGNWTERTYDVTAGTHTFQWRYTKDSSVNSNDDCFYVDYINFYKQPEPPVPGMTYDFENSTMQGWTSLDADGDGYGWYVASDIMSTGYGHDGSNDCVLSQSYYSGLVLYPDNYLVSPQVALGGVLTFYACAQDNLYAAEHFGVAVSTTSNTNPSAFTMLNEWTMTAKKVEGKSMDNAVADVNRTGISRDGKSRAQGNWYQYTVDLSAYAGQTGYVAIRHFNCSDMFYLDVDDITISDPSKSAPATRRFDHYRIYRTNCYAECPYTEDNTVLLATNWPGDTIYIDVEWADLPAGVYKWGVGCVYEGNRGELIEGPISWAAPVAVGNRSFTTSEAAQIGPKANVEVAEQPQDRDRAYLQYSTETFSGGVGTGGGAVYWGIRFPAADLAAYAGQTLTKVGVFMDVDGDYGWTYSGTYTANVYQGGATAPGTLVSSASEYLPGDLAWHDITLTTPVTIDATQDLWLCFYTPDIAYPMSGCDYVGNTNSDFLSLDGTTWEHANDYGLGYTWMIRGYVEAGGPTPPTPGGNNCNTLALPRESETIWSNCLDKDMYLNNDAVTVNVLLNSADSPEGVQVTFTNYNEYEQQTYGGYELVLDETGFYAFESFRKGEYNIKVEFEGYEPIEDSVSIWEATDLRYVMTEIIYGVSDLYVSSTGWAMWGAEGIPTPGGGGGGGGQGGSGDTFSFDCDGGMPAGWTTLDMDGDGLTWVSSNNPGVYHNSGVNLSGTGHNGSEAYVISGSYANGTGQVLYPDNYLVSPLVNLGAGSTFSFYACAQDASYAAEHFGVSVSSNGTDWTLVDEWTLTAKSTGAVSYGRDGNNRAQGNWYLKSVDLSSYAGQKYIAIRHFNCHDEFILNVDDIELSNGAKSGERHLEGFKVMCTSIDGEPIYNANVPAEQPFCQLATEELVPGDHYICKVAAMYSTGMSAWTECEWQYIPCDNYAGTVNGVTIEGNTISWDYPGGGGGGGGGGGQGDTFTVNFDDSQMPAGWTIIDGGSPAGYGWQLGSTKLGGTGNGHNGSADLILSQSYDNNYGVVYPDNWFISPAVTLGNGSQFSFWACGQDAGYAAEHCGVFVSTTGTNPSDFTMVNEWTLSAKSNGEKAAIRGNRDQGTWREYSVDLSAYAGAGRYIAIRHFNCSDMFYLDVDDVALTNGAKSRADWNFFNGYVTDPGAMSNGADASWTKGSQGTWGPNANYAASSPTYYWLADSFTLDAATTIDEIEVYGYQTGSTTTSTFTGLYAQIFNGNPMNGGTAVWGSNTSNIMTATAFTNCYRGSDGETTATTRPIMSITAGGLNIELEAGTYYLVYALTGSGTSGPWGAPHAEPGVGNTGSGVQCTSSGWTTLTDSGSGTTYGCAMKLHGNQGGTPGPTPTGDVLGAMIFADGEWEAFVEYPTNEYVYEGDAEEVCVRIVYNGTNTLPEGNIYFSMSCPECEPFTPGTITCEMPYAINIEPDNSNMSLKVWWGEEPAAPVSEWLYYDDGTYATSVGAGGTLYWGTMFPAASLAPYAGTSLTKVAIFTSYACSATLNVYVGGAQPGGSPAATQTFTMAGDQEFMEINLNNPVPVDGTQNLWITFYQSGETYPADACNDTGDANNRWVSIDGAQWMDLATAGLPGYGWMIRGFVTNQAKGGELASLPEFKGNVGGELSHSEVVSKPADLSFMNRATLVKYNVYRSTNAAGDYVLIGSVNEDGSNYYEYIDTPVEAGTYYYQVRAEYDNECESDPAMAADGSGNNYVSGTTTGDGMDELDGNVSLYPNPTKDNVTIEANGMSRISVVSVLGQVVFDKVIGADTYTLNMSQFTAGMYMVRVYTENGVSVKRVTVMQ